MSGSQERIREYFNRYREFLDSISPVSDEDWAFYSSFIKVRTYAAKEFFLQVDEPGNIFGFVISGLFKQYFTSIDGSQHITSFVAENRMISDFASLIRFAPSRTDILALEDSVVLVIVKPTARLEMKLNPTWENIGRVLAENRFIEKENKEWDFLNLDATERYAKFCREKTHILNRLSQTDIASYLGINNASLSRIRKANS